MFFWEPKKDRKTKQESLRDHSSAKTLVSLTQYPLQNCSFLKHQHSNSNSYGIQSIMNQKKQTAGSGWWFRSPPNLTICSLCQLQHFLKVSWKSNHNFLIKLLPRQTDKPTNITESTTSIVEVMNKHSHSYRHMLSYQWTYACFWAVEGIWITQNIYVHMMRIWTLCTERP